jgi:hypothetical protein
MSDTRITQESVDRIYKMSEECKDVKRKEALAKVWAFLFIGKSIQDREDAEKK